jgi:hypothetical protein
VSLCGVSGDLVRAKIDTGAETSSLHAEKLKISDKDGSMIARFRFKKHFVETPVIEFRSIKSSNGTSSLRPVVELELEIAGERFKTQFSLADRSEMRFPVLLGRETLAGRFLVDASDKQVLGTAREVRSK